MARHTTWALVGILLLRGTTLALAQDPRQIPVGASAGVTLDQLTFNVGSPRTATVLTFRSTRLERDAAALDLGAGLLLLPGAHGFSLEIGPAWSFPLPRLTILARGGFTAVAAVSRSSVGGAVGGYLGAGALVQVAPRLAVRGDLSHSWYRDEVDGTVKAWRIGIGLSAIPGKRRRVG